MTVRSLTRSRTFRPRRSRLGPLTLCLGVLAQISAAGAQPLEVYSTGNPVAGWTPVKVERANGAGATQKSAGTTKRKTAKSNRPAKPMAPTAVINAPVELPKEIPSRCATGCCNGSQQRCPGHRPQ